jgi:hypothetical protein
MNKTTLNIAFATALREAVDTDQIVFGLGGRPKDKNGDLNPNYKAFVVPVGELSDRQIVALALYGRRAINDSYNGEAHRCKKPLPTKMVPNPVPKPVPTKETWWKANWPSFGLTWGLRDGEDAPLSIEDRGWLAYFKALVRTDENGKEIKGLKINGKMVAEKTLGDAKEWYIRQVIFASLEGKALETAKADIGKAVETYRDKILQAAESDMDHGEPGWFIEREKNPIKLEGFKAKKLAL